MAWLKNMLDKKSTADVVSTEPDFPVQFGYKTAWYVIKGETPLSIIEKLKLTVISEANWASGLKEAYAKNAIFVSPIIDDCVLVINLTHWNSDDVKEDGKLFSELQFFGSHRVADYYAWAKFVNRELLRFYSYVGDLTEFKNEGELTSEELALGFDKYPQVDNFDEWTDEDWELAAFPDEDSVISIAQAWGIDPFFGDGTFSDGKYGKGIGFFCKYRRD